MDYLDYKDTDARNIKDEKKTTENIYLNSTFSNHPSVHSLDPFQFITHSLVTVNIIIIVHLYPQFLRTPDKDNRII